MKNRDKKKTQTPRQAAEGIVARDSERWPMVRKHLRLGWWSLLLFLTLGIVLESMHGFKVQWYVGEDNTTRRLMWTLAHAHGTLMSLIHLAYAFTIQVTASGASRSLIIRSWCLLLATILLPVGFFLGGFYFMDGDPGPGILLVPAGAGLLFVAVLLTALSIDRSST